MSERKTEVKIYYGVDRDSIQRTQKAAAEVAKTVSKQAAQAAADAAKAAQQMAKEWEKQAEQTARSMQRLRDAADLGGDLAEGFIAAGAAISGPLLLSLNSYLQSANQADAVARRWQATTERLRESQKRVGREVAQSVLPLLEDAADVAGKAADFAESNPGVIRAALTIGTVTAALGAVGVAVSKGIRFYADAKQLVAEMAAARMQNQAADKQLAAAALQGKSAVGGVAAATGTTAASTAAGGTAAGVVATGGALAAGGLALGFAGHEALSRTGFGQALGMESGTAGKALSIAAYGLGSVVGKGNEAFAAVARWTGQMEETAEIATRNVDETATALQRMMGTLQAGVDDIAQQVKSEWAGEVIAAAEQVAEIESQIADDVQSARGDVARQVAAEELRWARVAEDAVIAAERRKADVAKRTAEKRVQISQRYAEAIVQTELQYAQAVESAQQAHGKRLADIEETYQKRVQSIQKQYQQSTWDALLNRDAMALYQARRTRDEQLRQAQDERGEQTQDAHEQHQEQLQQARQARAEQLQAAQAARQEALADLKESLRQEAEEQALAERRKREDQQLARQRADADRQQWLAERLQQINAQYAAEQAAAQAHYKTLLAQENAYQRASSSYAGYALPQQVPAGGSAAPRAFASGGYTGAGGLALLHSGEFVLNAQTTRQVEGNLGYLSQSKIQRALGGGGPQITLPLIINQGEMQPREVARLAGAEVERRLIDLLQD